MKNIGIIVNNKKDPDFKYFKYLIKLLLDNGFTPIVTKEYRSVLPDEKVVKSTPDEMFKSSSLVITLGGDGTLLNIAILLSLIEPILIKYLKYLMVN